MRTDRQTDIMKLIVAFRSFFFRKRLNMLAILLPDSPYEKKKKNVARVRINASFWRSASWQKPVSDTFRGYAACTRQSDEKSRGKAVDLLTCPESPPFMTVSLDRSLNGLTSSQPKAAQWIRQALNTDKDLLLTAKPPSSKEPCFWWQSSLQIPA